MRPGDAWIGVRPLVNGRVYLMDMIFTSQTTDAIHTLIWATPTNCPPVFLRLPIGNTFASPQSRFFMNVKFKYLLSLLQLLIIYLCYHITLLYIYIYINRNIKLKGRCTANTDSIDLLFMFIHLPLIHFAPPPRLLIDFKNCKRLTYF